MEVRLRKEQTSTKPNKHLEHDKPLPETASTLNPSTNTCFMAFLLVQTLSSHFNYISDCDEVFNYWEPTYFLQYGRGLQTWEYRHVFSSFGGLWFCAFKLIYELWRESFFEAFRLFLIVSSPEYALRSYAYLYPQTLVGMAAQNLGFSKVQQFYLIRLFLGAFCALCQTYLYSSIRWHPHYKNTPVPLVTFVFLVFSTGMFISGTAYLPSTFAMCCFMIAQGAWLKERHSLSIVMVAIAALVGWPFSALAGLPIAFDSIYKRGFFYFLLWAIIGAIVSLAPLILIDTSLYQKLVIAPLNIVLYNVFKGGSSLYGTEPWHFYILNGFLNFNLILPLALLVIFIVAIPVGPKDAGHSKFRSMLYHLPMLIWFIFMSSIEHKEERFLFVVYPHIAFAGACALVGIENLLVTIGSYVLRENATKNLARALTFCVIFAIIILSMSRTAALYNNYNAPMKLYNHVAKVNPCGQQKVNFCIGKEWYRFSSQYFFPNDHFNLTFVRDGPQSQIDINECHYLVRNDPQNVEEPWEVVASFPFLDSAASPSLFRAFYIPVLSQKRNKWTNYSLFKNKKLDTCLV